MYADCKPISISVLRDVYVCRLRGAKVKKKNVQSSQVVLILCEVFRYLFLLTLFEAFPNNQAD